MIDDNLIKYAHHSATECDVYARRLQRKAHFVERRQRFMRFLGIVAGAIAVVLTFIPPFSTLVSPEVAKFASGIAAALLIADGIWPSIFSDSAERYRDYSYYIGLWAQSIRAAMVEPGLTDNARGAKLIVLAQLAETNLQQVRTQWEGVLPKIDAQQIAPADAATRRG
jgi:hypothetical protein